MCYFLTIGFKRSFKDRVVNIVKDIFEIQYNNDRSLQKQTSDDYLFVNIISGMCSCDLVDTEYRKKDKLKNKYLKKGWSKAKIDRALSSIEDGTGLKSEMRKLIADIVDKIGYVILFIHWYYGDLSREEIRINDTHYLSLEEFNLATIYEDIFYHIEKKIN